MITIEALIMTLKKNACEDNRHSMETYQRNQFPFLGIKSSDRRQLSKEFFSQIKEKNKSLIESGKQVRVDWLLVDQLWFQEAREFQYIAIDYLHLMDRYLTEEDLNYIYHLIVSKSWWDSVDGLVKRVGTIVNKYPHLKDTIIDWSLADNIWLRRTAIIHQLALKQDTDKDLLTQTIANNFGSDEFFINKAIGWALREYAKTNMLWVNTFVQDHKNQLSTLSMREALKNID